MFDRDTLFAHLRKKPFGRFTNGQVEGINAILDAHARYGAKTSVPQLAYVFATPHLETGGTMQPIKEWGGTAYFTKMYDIKGSRPAKARELGNLTPGDGAKYCGRGYVQLTGKNNYAKATKKLREMGFDVDFVNRPDDVMIPLYAAIIMFVGMEEGWFTGKDLDDYIDDRVDGDEHKDFVQARRIINGTDKAEAIAEYADAYLAALVAAQAAFKPLPEVTGSETLPFANASAKSCSV
jgi:putative chitinase